MTSKPREKKLILRRVEPEALIAATDYAKENGLGEKDVNLLPLDEQAYIVYGGEADKVLRPHLPHRLTLMNWGPVWLEPVKRVGVYEKAALIAVFRKCGITGPSKYMRRPTGLNIGDLR